MENKRQLLLKNKQFLLVIIINFALLNFWRGTWGLLDEYLFPLNYKFSLFISLFIGVLVAFFVQ